MGFSGSEPLVQMSHLCEKPNPRSKSRHRTCELSGQKHQADIIRSLQHQAGDGDRGTHSENTSDPYRSKLDVCQVNQRNNTKAQKAK